MIKGGLGSQARQFAPLSIARHKALKNFDFITVFLTMLTVVEYKSYVATNISKVEFYR